MTDYPLPKETVRGDSQLNVSKMERLPDGKIKMVFISKSDIQMKAPKTLMESFLQKGTKKWYDDIKKYYTKNHKKL